MGISTEVEMDKVARDGDIKHKNKISPLIIRITCSIVTKNYPTAKEFRVSTHHEKSVVTDPRPNPLAKNLNR